MSYLTFDEEAFTDFVMRDKDCIITHTECF